MNWRDRIRKAFAARDEGELENAIADLPDNAELHLHIAPTGTAETPAAVVAPDTGAVAPMDNAAERLGALGDAARAHDLESEELWEAIEGLERAVVMGDSPKPRDSWPHRDARRSRMGLRDRRARDEDEDKKDDDKDDEEKNADAFRDPPEAGDLGGKMRIPAFGIEAPEGTADRSIRARDSAWMADSFQETMALAEVLVPGVPMPTFDSAAPAKRTFDALCGFRARVLDHAWSQPDTRALIEDLTGRRFNGVKTMDCKQVRDLFIAVGNARRRENDLTRGATPRFAALPGDPLLPVGVTNIAELQELNRRAWAAKAS